MKLFNVLSVTVFGVLFAVGCSSTDTTTTDSGTDTGVAVDTGTTPADTGTAAETSGETGVDPAVCQACTADKCKSEIDACKAKTECPGVIMCVNDCADDTCANACLKDDTQPGVKEASDLLTCAQDNCKAECGF